MLNASSISWHGAVTRKREARGADGTLRAGEQVAYVLSLKVRFGRRRNFMKLLSESMRAPDRRRHRHICRSSRASVL